MVIWIVDMFGYVGVLCVEFFVLEDGLFVVNEMVLCLYNFGYYMVDVCVMS